MSSPRIVLDTNVLVSAQRSQRGASSKLMSLLGSDLFDVCVSVALVLEYEYVLTAHRSVRRLTQDDISDLIDAVCALTVHQDKIHFRWRPQLQDVDDEFVLEAAIAAHCDFIVTFNTKNFVGSRTFGIEVIRPNQFLERIGAL